MKKLNFSSSCRFRSLSCCTLKNLAPIFQNQQSVKNAAAEFYCHGLHFLTHISMLGMEGVVTGVVSIQLDSKDSSRVESINFA